MAGAGTGVESFTLPCDVVDFDVGRDDVGRDEGRLITAGELEERLVIKGVDLILDGFAAGEGALTSLQGGLQDLAGVLTGVVVGVARDGGTVEAALVDWTATRELGLRTGVVAELGRVGT